MHTLCIVFVGWHVEGVFILVLTLFSPLSIVNNEVCDIQQFIWISTRWHTKVELYLLWFERLDR